MARGAPAVHPSCDPPTQTGHGAHTQLCAHTPGAPAGCSAAGVAEAAAYTAPCCLTDDAAPTLLPVGATPQRERHGHTCMHSHVMQQAAGGATDGNGQT
jgi:hypothetical protein